MFEFEFTFLLVSNCRRSDKVSRDFNNKNSGSLTTFCGVSTQYTRNNVSLLLLLTSHHSQRVDNGFKRHCLKMHHQTNTKQFHLRAKHSNVIKNTQLLSVKYIQTSDIDIRHRQFTAILVFLYVLDYFYNPIPQRSGRTLTKIQAQKFATE